MSRNRNRGPLHQLISDLHDERRFMRDNGYQGEAVALQGALRVAYDLSYGRPVAAETMRDLWQACTRIEEKLGDQGFRDQVSEEICKLNNPELESAWRKLEMLQ